MRQSVGRTGTYRRSGGRGLTLLLLCELVVDLYVLVCAFVGECVVGLVEELAHCAMDGWVVSSQFSHRGARAGRQDSGPGERTTH